MSSTMPEWTPLTNKTFFEFVKSHRLVVVHFWAAWNAVDVTLRKLLDSQVTESLREMIAFATFDTDPPAHFEICREHKVVNLPFLAFYRDGAMFRSVIGLRGPEVITTYMQELVEVDLK